MPFETSKKKKLKQSRLPFSPIDPKNQKKRKLSNETGNQCSKALRIEEDLSKEKDCKPPKEQEDIEIINDVEEYGEVVEEKENLKNKSEEKIATNVENAKVVEEDSNDGIEVLEVIEKSDGSESASESKNKSPVSEQELEKADKTVITAKKKRKNSLTASSNVKTAKKKRKNSLTASSNIKKLFKDMEGKQDAAPTKISKDSEVKEESDKKKEESSKDEISILSQNSKETELNESSESNCTTGTSDSNTPNSSSEGKTKDHDVSISKTPSQKTSNSSSECKTKDHNVSISKTPSQKTSLVKKKLGPKQKLLEEEKKKKQEERLQLKLQKDQEKKDKELEKQRLKEERQRKRMEEIEMKEKEKEEKKQKREEERQRREEKKEEERQKKEEERLKKEEEKQKKDEERLLAEEEEREKQKKLKQKFAQFFVPKKADLQNESMEAEKISSDNFVHFRVKDNMKIAPLVRRSFSKNEKESFEKLLQNPPYEAHKYLREIKQESYRRGRSSRTFPPLDKCQDDEICEIISDDEEIDGTDVLEVKSSQTKKIRAKFLKFCENSRPAYYGTWSKKSVHISGRKPFRKEEIFDYDYDSDEDWEDIENGESLSDSDGEADDGGKEDSNQYEVDNDFFVPHGYLSEGEGEEDGEIKEEAEEENKEKDENFQKERLKQKQEEFEMEMKQKTKHLKPKVYGCVWLGDSSSHKAYDQLVKILLPYKSMVMFGTCPIEVGKESNNHELKENDDEEGHEDDSSRKFVKSFPEKATPDLIRLIHGNRHSKLFLIREFSEYWKKKAGDEADSDSGFIAMRKIEPKIQEIGQYGRFSENGISLKYRTWYVSKEIRAKYGLEDLSMNNRWQYTLPVKEWKYESKDEKPDEPEESPSSKSHPKSPFTGTNLITKFTKVLNGEEEKKKLFNITSSNGNNTPSTDNIKTPDKLGLVNNSPATPCSSGKKEKKKVNLISVSKEKTPNSKTKSIVAMFKNIAREKSSPKDKNKQIEDCITLE